MPVTEDNEISAIMKRKKEILEEKLRSMNEIKKLKSLLISRIQILI